ncbi:hypothetical protein I7X12_06530 [Halosimplex litoreum]|uniref:Uncharacterized protein n=1 Tax=Halosimplex litoreum TaxID=1198301 RepID=A0A7T3G180_9EURY|nr:hypothetical protein [Halosimplex litoreum]QPV64267.1 hypothetical protein I7X12_06530 [Halosimplex litoreum]
MAAAAGDLTEPQVLAHTKRRLFPEDGVDAYAVVDTQFAQERWVDRATIDEAVREALAPFNHVRVGSGYPDLVGVRPLDDELLAVDRLGGEPPLIAVEAKGYAGGGVDTERGIVQARDRLGEANVAFLAAPATALSQTDRSLARECNVGVLAVENDGAVRTLERPRVVGNRTADAATSIRFQASTQGVAGKNFGLNHPKNYLAYPLAVAHERDTETVLAERVVGATDAARVGAEFLNLVAVEPNWTTLTALGREVVRFALAECGSVDAALDTFEDWKRSRKRFCEVAPKWGQLARRVVYAYPATELLVTELQSLHDDGERRPTLRAFVEYLHELHPTFTVELFLRGDEGVRERALTEDGDLRTEALADGNAYHSPTVFQLKAMLYHAGVLTERGSEPHRLDPREDRWALRHDVGPVRG